MTALSVLGPCAICRIRGTPVFCFLFFPHSPVELVNTSPIGYQSQALQKLIPWVAAINAGVSDIDVSFVQGDNGDLVLLLEQTGERWKELCPLASPFSREDHNQPQDVC